MQPVLLLNGFLGPETLKSSLIELREMCSGHDDIFIIVNSTGGNTPATLDFIDGATKLLVSKTVHVKIYRAQSSAAMIAISLANHLEIKKDGLLSLHLPELTFSTIEILGEKVSLRIQAEILRANKAIRNNLEKIGLDKEPKLMSIIEAGEWIHFTGLDCLQREIAESVF
jgi:hypothetical protein